MSLFSKKKSSYVYRVQMPDGSIASIDTLSADWPRLLPQFRVPYKELNPDGPVSERYKGLALDYGWSQALSRHPGGDRAHLIAGGPVEFNLAGINPQGSMIAAKVLLTAAEMIATWEGGARSGGLRSAFVASLDRIGGWAPLNSAGGGTTGGVAIQWDASWVAVGNSEFEGDGPAVTMVGPWLGGTPQQNAMSLQVCQALRDAAHTAMNRPR